MGPIAMFDFPYYSCITPCSISALFPVSHATIISILNLQ